MKRTCSQTVTSGRISIRFVDFPTFLFDFDRVRCVLLMSFLVRNWCGVHLVVGLNDFNPCLNAGCQAKGMHAEDAACAKRSFPNLLAWPVSRPRPSRAIFGEGRLLADCIEKLLFADD
jgi:hypothetical protein